MRDWLKTKVSETAAFVITGYIEREAVAKFKDGVLVPVGLVKLGLPGKGLWRHLARCAPTRRRNPALSPCAPELVAEIKFFGRYRSGFVRHGVLLTVS